MRTILTTVLKTILVTSTVVITLIVLGIGLLSLAHQSDVDHLQASMVKPKLPVSVAFRNAFFGPGAVAVFRNNSSQLLEIEATFTSPTNRYASFQLIIPSWGEKEFGPLDGWSFINGQHIKLINSQFRPMEIAVR